MQRQPQRRQHPWPWTLMDPRSQEYAQYEAHEAAANEASRAACHPPPSPRGGLLALSHHASDMAVIAAHRLGARSEPGFYFFDIGAGGGDATAPSLPPWISASDMMSWLAFNCPHASVAAMLCLNVHAYGGLCTCAVMDPALGDVRFYAVAPGGRTV